MNKQQEQKTLDLANLQWAPRIQRFSRKELEKAWPRVLTVESSLYGSAAHKARL
jgi:hypothetical protein